MLNTLLVDAATVQQTLSMGTCIRLMTKVQQELSRGDISLPPRSFYDLSAATSGPHSHFGVMPGELARAGVFGAKLISLLPHNPSQGRPSIQGGIVLFDSIDGALVSLIDAASITAIRTAAASGAATALLANKNSQHLALLGCGVQAASHLNAMCEVLPITQVTVWGRSQQKAQAFAEQQMQLLGLPVSVAPTPATALQDAEVVCAVSGAEEPIIEGQMLRPGTHVNLVGAHTPTAREADGATMARARVFTEIREVALREAGDLILAIAEGAISADHIVGDIGAVAEGAIIGRTNRNQITVYKSLGNTAQDLVAAHYIYQQLTA